MELVLGEGTPSELMTAFDDVGGEETTVDTSILIG